MWLQNLLIFADRTLTTSDRSETMPIGIFWPKNLSDPNLGLLGPSHVAAEPPDLPQQHPDYLGQVSDRAHWNFQAQKPL